MISIAEAFAQAKGEGRAAIIPYLTAGYPSPESYLQIAKNLLRHADMMEVGIPFSDPLGDGPTIQKAGEKALQNGMNFAKTLSLIRELRQETDKPLLVMTYINPVISVGPQDFFGALAKAGVNGVILPDLPPDQDAALVSEARSTGLDTVFLIAPTSNDERIRTVTSYTSGFIYLVSVTGVTGARRRLPDLSGLVAAIRRVSDLPVAIGFGVSSAETAAQAARQADGVVVGSALLKEIARGGDPEALLEEIATAAKVR